jgi:hypothetical protein
LQRTKYSLVTPHRKARENRLSGVLANPLGARATPLNHQPSDKKTYFSATLDGAGDLPRGDSMSDIRADLKSIRADLKRPVPSIVPSDVPAVASDIPALSDDECLVRLAQAVRGCDSADLDEVARLIGRLAVTIE